MGVLLIFLRVLHIGAAVVLGGALVYQRFAVRPALCGLEPAQRQGLTLRLLQRWSGVVWVGVAVLLVSGLINYLEFKIPEYAPRPYKGVYHAVLGVKILAALALFHVAAMVTLPVARDPARRAGAGKWLTWGVCLLAVIIVLAAVARYLPTLYGA